MNMECFVSCLETRGFVVIETGGGCTAWQWEHKNHEILITQDGSHEIEEEYLEDQGIALTVYSDSVNNVFDTYECATYQQALDAIFNFKVAIKLKADADIFFEQAEIHARSV